MLTKRIGFYKIKVINSFSLYLTFTQVLLCLPLYVANKLGNRGFTVEAIMSNKYDNYAKYYAAYFVMLLYNFMAILMLAYPGKLGFFPAIEIVQPYVVLVYFFYAWFIISVMVVGNVGGKSLIIHPNSGFLFWV